MAAVEVTTALQILLAEPNMTADSRVYTPVRERWIALDPDSGTTFRAVHSYERVREFERGNEIIPALSAVSIADVIADEVPSGATAAGPAMDIVDSEPSPFDSVVAQIIRLGAFGADWDGNDASPPDPDSLKDARAFVRALAPESVVPQATLHADGTAALLLMTSDVYVELEFLGSKVVGYFARRGGQEWNDDFSFGDGSLPSALSAIGFAFEKKPDIAVK